MLVKVENDEYLESQPDYFGLVRPLDVQAPATYRSATGPCKLKNGTGYVVILNTGSTGLHVYPGLPVSEIHLANKNDFEWKDVLVGTPEEQWDLWLKVKQKLRKNEVHAEIRNGNKEFSTRKIRIPPIEVKKGRSSLSQIVGSWIQIMLRC